MRLPEIQYNVDGVRPLAKEDPGLAARKAATEINLSRTWLGAELDKAGKIGQANVGLARSKLAADVNLISAQRDISIAAHDFRTKMKAADKAAKRQLVGSIAQTVLTTVASMLDKQAERRDAQQSGEAKLSFAKAIGQFQAENIGVEAFEAGKLPAGVYPGDKTLPQVNGGQAPIQVPRNEVYPELWKHQAETALESASNLIVNPVVRDKFRLQSELDIQSSYLGMLESSGKAQVKEYNAVQQANVKTLIGEGQLDLAGNYLESTTLPESEKIIYRSQIGINKETGKLHKLLSTDNHEQMLVTAANLQSEDYKGKLPAESRFSWAQKLMVKVEKSREIGKDLQVAIKAEATEIAESVLGEMIKGKILDRGEIERVIKHAESSGVNPALVHNLRKESKNLYANQLFHAAPATERAAIVRSMDSSSTTPEGRILAQRYARENDRITKALREDPMQYVHDQDLHQLEPFKPTSADFWRTRKLQAKATSDRFNIRAPLLTAEEAQMISDNFASSNPAQQVELITGLQQRLGDDADRVFDQVGLNNPSIRVMSLVDTRTAAEALHGAEIRREYPQAVPKRGDLQHDLTRHFGNAMVTTPKLRESLEQFTMDLYAAKAGKLGDLSGEYDRKIMKDVLKAIPLVEYKGQTFISPADGVDSKAFTHWMKYSEPKALIGGGIPYLADEDVVRHIQSGSFTLLQAGRNEFLLIDTETGRLISTDGTAPFVLTYRPELPYRGTYGFPYDPQKKQTVGDIMRNWNELEGVHGVE